MTNIACSTGCALFSLSLSLSLVACTQDRSVGAVDNPADGGGDVQPVADAVDGPIGVPCVDNGVSYQLGDVIPRGSSSCLTSCICLAGGIVGRCTGACPAADAALDGAPNPSEVATITLTASTNAAEIRVEIFDDGSARRIVIAPSGDPAGLAHSYPPGSPEVTLFLYHLSSVGDLSAVGYPTPTLALSACAKSVSFGTLTTVTAGGVTSGDVQCLIDPTPARTALGHDCEVLTGMDDALFNSVAKLCVSAGGTVSSGLCCSSTGDFPDQCAVGACTCSPTGNHTVATCACPTGTCFLAGRGCAGPSGTCTIGADQTCNDNPTFNSIHGQCVTGGRCLCKGGTPFVAASGKCQ